MNSSKRGNILIVDDDPGMREFLSFVLTSEGYTVLAAASGDEALAHVRERKQNRESIAGVEIDLTIMDIKMPPPEGVEVLRQLREIDPDAVVILITGYASLETAMQAVRFGAYDYLTKPLDDVGELLTVVQRGFNRRRLLVNSRSSLTRFRNAYEENLHLLEETQALNRDLETRLAERSWQLDRAKRRSQNLDRLKAELLANVSHELYTPLNAVIGFSQALLDGLHGPLSDAQARLVKSIQSSGYLLKSSFDDLIDVARLQADEVTIASQSLSLSHLLQAIRTQAERSARGKGIEIVIQVPPHLRTIWADEAKLRRMLYELLSNAVRFTPAGGRVILKVTLHPPEQPRELRLMVSDTGMGIPADELEAIFDPFHQVDTSLSRRFGGLGLGLAIVRHYAELHGGRVWAESELGQGSTFILVLPLTSTLVDKSLGPPVKFDAGQRE
jgi:signal transduction histidine kinase